MEFRVLGPLEVAIRGRLVDLGGRKPRAVLAMLLVEASRVVPLDRLVDQLWTDQPPAQAVGTVRSYLSNLRRALEPDRPPGRTPSVLVSRSSGYGQGGRLRRAGARCGRTNHAGGPTEGAGGASVRPG